LARILLHLRTLATGSVALSEFGFPPCRRPFFAARKSCIVWCDCWKERRVLLVRALADRFPLILLRIGQVQLAGKLAESVMSPFALEAVTMSLAHAGAGPKAEEWRKARGLLLR